MKITKEAVLSAVRKQGPLGLTTDELVEALGLDAMASLELSATLNEMAVAEMLILESGQRVLAAGSYPKNTVGRITVHPKGFGFVVLESGEDDVFVVKGDTKNALDGDRVQIKTRSGRKGTEGTVIEVLARHRRKLTGVIGGNPKRKMFIRPDDPRIAFAHRKVFIDNVSTQEGSDKLVGQVGVVEISQYPETLGGSITGALVATLGLPGDPSVEIAKILAMRDVSEEFSELELLQSTETPDVVLPSDFEDRVDMTEYDFCTIDPVTARDFDDALCVREKANGKGTTVWVAVADVSHYVRPQDALDVCAQKRSVSIYLPNKVIPMLPFALSAEICSLKPDVNRCAMVVQLEYTSDGKLADVDAFAAIIRSKARLDYPGVAAALKGDVRGDRQKYKKWIPKLTLLDSLAQKLRKKRRNRGALELSLSEAKVVLDADDPLLVRDIVKAKADPGVKSAYELVEEFMIAANEAVGALFANSELPCVWRIHAPPDPKRLEEIVPILANVGIELDPEEAQEPKGLQKVLHQIGQLEAKETMSFVVLRSLKRASYDTAAIGHFGLASKTYVHFTSPIRRYPDVLVHRLLKRLLRKQGKPAAGGSEANYNITSLSALAHSVSTNERRATEIERDVVSMYRAYIMREHIGERFSGRISGIVEFGVFVEIDSPFVEGLIKLEDLGAEPFAFDPMALTLTGRQSGNSFAIGHVVEVIVRDVSIENRKIDLEIVGSQGGRSAPRPKRFEGLLRKHRGKSGKNKAGKSSKATKTRGKKKVGGKKAGGKKAGGKKAGGKKRASGKQKRRK